MEIRESYRLLQQGRLRTARDEAFAAHRVRLVAVTRDAGSGHLKPHKLSAQARALLFV